jgi:hypothetical protein
MSNETLLLSTGNYILSYLGLCDALMTEQAYQDALSKSKFLPEAERAMAAVVAATIGIRLLDIAATHEVFMQRLHGSVNPPGEGQIERAVDLSKKLAGDLHRAVVASAMLDILNTGINDWTKILKA